MAELFAAVAAAAETAPHMGRWGIPEAIVERDTAEALRWSPVLAATVPLATAVIAEARLRDGSLARAWLGIGAGT